MFNKTDNKSTVTCASLSYYFNKNFNLIYHLEYFNVIDCINQHQSSQFK